MQCPFWICRSVLVVLCLLLVALALSGCGGGEGGGKKPADNAKTTVLVMRHCFRATPDDSIHDISGLPFFNNYSSSPWPPFGVPAMQCLPRGISLAEAAGAWLKQYGQLPEPLRVIADDCKRDIVTGRAFLKGFGAAVDNSTLVVDPGPFNGVVSPACPAVSSADAIAAVKEQLAAHPMPEPGFSTLLAKLYAVLGEGAAGIWTNTSCHMNTASGYLDGSCSAASDFVERLLMEWGGGLTIAWDRVLPAEIAELLTLHEWYRTIMFAVPKLVAREEASIFRAVHDVLAAGQPGTTVFAGHDSQLNALAAGLDLTWTPSPFPVNATLPSSALRFERVGTQLRAEYVYITNVSEESGHMSTTPAFFGGTGKSTISLQDFSARVESGSNATCASSFPGEDGIGHVDHASLLRHAEPRVRDGDVEEMVV